MLNKILIILVLIAAGLITVIIFNLITLSKYQKCWTTPLSNMPSYCQDLNESQGI